MLSRTCSFPPGRLARLPDDRVKSGLRFVVAVEQERPALPAPGDGVVHAPKRNELHGVAVLQEGPENSRVGIGQFLVRLRDEAALCGGGVVGDVRTKAA